MSVAARGSATRPSRGGETIAPPTRLADWPAALAWALALGMPGLVILLSPQGFQAAFLVAGLLALPAALSSTSSAGRRSGAPVPAFDPLVLAFLAALLGWAMIGLLWTASAGRAAGLVAAGLGVALAGLALVRALVDGRARRWGRIACIWGLGTAIALGLVDLLSEGAVQGLTRPNTIWMVYEVNRLCAVIALLVWPALFLARTTPGRIALLAGAGAMAGLGDSQTAILSLAAGGLVFVGTRVSRRARTMLVVALPLAVLAAPWILLVLDGLTSTALARVLPAYTGLIRLQIWHAAAELWWSAPLHGLGLEAIRGATLPEIAWTFPDMRINHPHNAFLQSALDLGLVGNALLAGLVFALARLGTRSARAPLHLTALTAAMAAMATSWSLWATWWLATLAALALACLLAERMTGR